MTAIIFCLIYHTLTVKESNVPLLLPTMSSHFIPSHLDSADEDGGKITLEAVLRSENLDADFDTEPPDGV